MVAELVKVDRIFQRNKVAFEEKHLGALLCFACLSCRRGLSLLEGYPTSLCVASS